jgi:hypothetical protein
MADPNRCERASCLAAADADRSYQPRSSSSRLRATTRVAQALLRAFELAFELLQSSVRANTASVQLDSQKRDTVAVIVRLGLKLLDLVARAHASNSSTEGRVVRQNLTNSRRGYRALATTRRRTADAVASRNPRSRCGRSSESGRPTSVKQPTLAGAHTPRAPGGRAPTWPPAPARHQRPTTQQTPTDAAPPRDRGLSAGSRLAAAAIAHLSPTAALGIRAEPTAAPRRSLRGTHTSGLEPGQDEQRAGHRRRSHPDQQLVFGSYRCSAAGVSVGCGG